MMILSLMIVGLQCLKVISCFNYYIFKTMSNAEGADLISNSWSKVRTYETSFKICYMAVISSRTSAQEV